MMHSVPSTFSPSSLRMTRSTPCVEGCCGPMFSTSSVESRNVDSGMESLSAFDVQVLLYPTVVLLEDRNVLAQWESHPLFRQQNAPHIRMPRELDAEHVEHLALQPVGARMNVYRGRRLVALRNVRLHADASVAPVAVQNVDEVEPLRALQPVDGRNVH